MTKRAKDISLQTVKKYIQKSSNILLATHENPDGDGLGSIIALAEGLRQLGKKVTLYCKDPVPKMYHFLKGHKEIKTKLPKNKKFDTTFIVDLGEIERVGEDFVNYPGRQTTISLDHHAEGSHNCDYNFCLPKQASSGEVIYKVLKVFPKIKWNQKMAMGIYTAMSTDTGSFKYSNTTAETFAIAQDLMKYKVDPWTVAMHCFETYSVARMTLLKMVLQRLEIHSNKKIAWITLKQSDYKNTGAAPDEAEGFINYPRSIETVEVAIAFKEVKKNFYKISLRSKTYFNVAKLAAKFGGGGHIRASGCKIQGSLKDVQKKLIKEIIPGLK